MAAGVLADARGDILVSRRFDDAHQGGLWEFPGGKLESGESVLAGLSRELTEEIGVRVETARPLIRVHHDYPERGVLLDVWRVSDWRGRVHGREGQELSWLPAERLRELPMPAADVPVVSAVRLPDRYLVTPPPEQDRDAFLEALAASLAAGVRLVALRAKPLPDTELTDLARQMARICHDAGAHLLINACPSLLDASGADGVHLTSARLMAAKSRPVPADAWLAASCHDSSELEQAERIGADFGVLSPVAASASHAHTQPLGWRRFQALVEGVNLPVFALGGMGCEHLNAAWEHGGQGIAAIRGLWKGPVGGGQ